MTLKLRIKLARYQPAQSEIHLRQKLRTYTTDKRVLIGYPNGQDGLILPAHECPFCSRAGKKNCTKQTTYELERKSSSESSYFDSNFRFGCRNVSHYYSQHSFLRLLNHTTQSIVALAFKPFPVFHLSYLRLFAYHRKLWKGHQSWMERSNILHWESSPANLLYPYKTNQESLLPRLYGLIQK